MGYGVHEKQFRLLKKMIRTHFTTHLTHWEFNKFIKICLIVESNFGGDPYVSHQIEK